MFAVEFRGDNRLVIALDIAEVAGLLEHGFTEAVELASDDGQAMQVSLSLQQQLDPEAGAPPEQIPEGIDVINMRCDPQAVQEARDALARIFRVCPALQLKLRTLLLAAYIDGWNDRRRVVTILEDEAADAASILGDGWQHGDQLEDCGLRRSQIVAGLAAEMAEGAGELS